MRAGDIGNFAGRPEHGTAAAAQAAIPLLEAADDRFGDRWARVRAGTLRLFLAYTLPDRTAAVTELLDAMRELDLALARAPAADPAAWAALAQGRAAVGDRRAARRAFDMSLRLAPYQPELAFWRSELGLTLMAALDEEERRQWGRQVRAAWDFSRPAVLALARHNPGAAALMTEALAADPQILLEFERELRQ